jgi:predicted ABC-type transport system involved in lysophospholipase L1 biosynthesis ATPase subunit
LKIPARRGATSRELGRNLVIRESSPRTKIRPASVNFAAQKFRVLVRLAALLNVVTHQLAHDLRGRPVSGGDSSHETVAQLRFQLHRENSF